MFVLGLYFASACVRMVVNHSSAIILVFQLIRLTTGLSSLHRLYPSFHRATRSCGKHALSVTTASCVNELHPETDGSQQAHLSQSFSLSFSLSQCLIHLIKEQINAFLAWPILDKHYCLVKPTAIILLYFIKHLNCSKCCSGFYNKQK